jgi:hypothetical protein
MINSGIGQLAPMEQHQATMCYRMAAIAVRANIATARCFRGRFAAFLF